MRFDVRIGGVEMVAPNFVEKRSIILMWMYIAKHFVGLFSMYIIEKSSMDRCFESSTDSFPRLASCSSGEVPPLCSLDILKPEVNDSRMVCFEDEIGAIDSELFLETSKGPEKGEGSAAGVRATKCDAEVQLQFGGNDGRLEDSGPVVDHTSLSGKNGAEVSVQGNRRSYRPHPIDGTSLSEEEKEKQRETKMEQFIHYS